MKRLQAVLVSPHLIDCILAFTVIEGFVVARWRRRSATDVAAMLLPGIFLLLAVRAALAGAAWPWVPAALAVALVAHLADLCVRWRG
jgi:hypothetical protein